ATGLQLLSGNPSLKVAILEKEDRVGRHQTGNNSGVIHSGLYYKPGSLKALNCTRGYNMLIEFCQRHNIPYELCGKIIIATAERPEATYHAFSGTNPRIRAACGWYSWDIRAADRHR